MLRFLLAIIALVVLLAAILIVAPGLVPVAAYKGRIEAAASQALGREVSIGDDLRLKIIPITAFRVSDLVIANEAGFEGEHLARVKAADIGVKLFALLRGEIELDRFVLTEPDLNLVVARDGAVNWNLAAAPAEGEPAAEDRRVRDLRLGDVRIVDGRARYADLREGRRYAIEDIDMTVRLASLDQPLELDGTMTFEGAPSRANIILTTLGGMMAGEDANLKLDVRLGETSAGADLVVRTGAALSYSGPARLDAPNLRAFAALLGSPLAPSPGFDRLRVEGQTTGTGDAIRVENARIRFDEIDAEGALALNWAGARPKATGQLSASRLDLRPYLPKPAEDASGFPAWSEDKMDFSGLRNIDAQLDIAAGEVLLHDLRLEDTRMRLAIDAGRMVADISRLGLYGGAGAGQIIVNARQAAPSFSGSFDVAAVRAENFATDFLNTDRLLGLGGFKIAFNATGASQAEIMRTLSGSGGFDVADGALKGINIARIAQAAADIRTRGLNPATIAEALASAQSPAEETEFTEFLSQFNIANGLISTQNISLAGPFVRMTGAGSVNLPAQSIDLRLSPRAMTAAAGGEEAYSITVPMRVSGTFSRPQVSIDMEALMRGRVEDTARGLIQRAVPGQQRPAGEGETQPRTPQDELRGVLERALPGRQPQQPPADQPSGQDSAPTPEQDSRGLGERLLEGVFTRPTRPQPQQPQQQQDDPQADEPDGN